LPDRMQRVQAETRFVAPPTTALTVFRFRCHLRLVTLCAWLMRCPLRGVFPQNSQCWAMPTFPRPFGQKTREAYTLHGDEARTVSRGAEKDSWPTSDGTCPGGLSLCMTDGFVCLDS
jgi:hypothetical protein